MTLTSDPPLITSQMPWWEAVQWLCVLPLACWLFRWFARGPMAHSFHNRFTLRIGIGVASLILAAGFICAGHALRELLNYTRIEKEGIRQVKFAQKDKFQRWDELTDAQMVQRNPFSDPALQSTTVTLEFKEDGRWREYITFDSALFSDTDFQRFQEWLESHLTFVPQTPPPLPPGLFRDKDGQVRKR